MRTLFDDLWLMAKATPFRPFQLHVSGGHSLPIATADHVCVFPTKNIVLVIKDDGNWEMIDIPNVVRITSDGALPSGAR